MSQKKVQYYDAKNNKNRPLIRSSEPVKKFQSHIRISNKPGRYSTKTESKLTESSLLNEDQRFYRFRYTLEDKADDSNTVFYDSNSKKYRNRSTTKAQNTSKFTDTFNANPTSNVRMNTKNYANMGNTNSNTRNNNNLIKSKFNNKTENFSNKINLIKINEKNVKNPQIREKIITQLKKEKEELIGQSNSYKKNQLTQNSYIKNKGTSKNEQKSSINNNNPQNKYTRQNKNTELPTKSFESNQKTPIKNKKEYSTSTNKKLYSAIPSTNKRGQNDNNNYNRNKILNKAPELPQYKQKMTNTNKTNTSVTPRINKGDNNLNRNTNRDKNIGENMNKKGVKFNMKENDSIEEKKHLNQEMIPTGFKNEKEFEAFMETLNKKGDKITPKEKEKRLNCIKDLLDNITKGKSAQNNLDKIGKLLSNMNEKDKKEILEKLGKSIGNKNLLSKLGNQLEKISSKNESNKNGKFESNKDFSNSKQFESGFKSLNSEYVSEINPLKFEGLFLDMSKYSNDKREKNPFEGPSPYIELYKERRSQIKQKLELLSNSEFDRNEGSDSKGKSKI